MNIPGRGLPAVHVIFTEDDLPRWFGPEPVQDSKPLDLEELRHLLPAAAPENALAASWQGILITHRRVGGIWLLREVFSSAAERPDPAEGIETGPPPETDPAANYPEVDAAE